MTAKFLVFAGICLVGSSSAIVMDLYFQLRKIGINPSNWVKVPREYLRVRKKYGWPAWPVYLILPLLIAGAALLFMGASKL